MNRSGLFTALALALVVGLLFGIYPELDLQLAGLFFDASNQTFPLKFNTLAMIARDAAMWIAWGLALPSIVALVIKLARPDKPLLVPGRTVFFLLVTLVLSAGILTNLAFKSYWGRPRPIVVTEFKGPQAFVAWWDPRGSCGRNCSFFSGEGRHRVLDLRARGIDAAGLAAAGLYCGDGVRRGHQRLADGVRRALLHRCRGRRAGDVSGDLAAPWLHLPLAVDPD